MRREIVVGEDLVQDTHLYFYSLLLIAKEWHIWTLFPVHIVSGGHTLRDFLWHPDNGILDGKFYHGV